MDTFAKLDRSQAGTIDHHSSIVRLLHSRHSPSLISSAHATPPSPPAYTWKPKSPLFTFPTDNTVVFTALKPTVLHASRRLPPLPTTPIAHTLTYPDTCHDGVRLVSPVRYSLRFLSTTVTLSPNRKRVDFLPSACASRFSSHRLRLLPVFSAIHYRLIWTYSTTLFLFLRVDFFSNVMDDLVERVNGRASFKAEQGKTDPSKPGSCRRERRSICGAYALL